MTDRIDPRHISLLLLDPDQAGVVAGLHALCFTPAWSEPEVRALLINPASLGFLARVTGEEGCQGFILTNLVEDECEILSFGVAPDWTQRGLGRHLLQGLKRAAGRAGAISIVLEVAADNVAALALYASEGFREVGRREAYYARSGRPAVAAIRLSAPMDPKIDAGAANGHATTL